MDLLIVGPVMVVILCIVLSEISKTRSLQRQVLELRDKVAEQNRKIEMLQEATEQNTER